MYTQCPDCQTRFRVNAAVLRAAYGMARCGRCGNAFDALVQLSDVVPPAGSSPAVPRTASDTFVAMEPAEEAGATAIGPSPAGSEETVGEATGVWVQEGGVGEDITMEGRLISFDGLPSPGEAERDLDATDQFEVLRIAASEYPDEQEAERELEALVQRLQREFDEQPPESGPEAEYEEDTTEIPTLVAPAGPQPLDAAAEVEPVERAAEAAPEPEPEPELEPEPVVEPVPEPLLVTPSAPQPVAAALQAEPELRATRVPVSELPLAAARRRRPEPVEAAPETAAGRSPWRTFAWALGSVLLLLLLAGQIAHHFRRDLLLDPRVGAPLRDVYERLGVALPSTWGLPAIELRQLGDDARGSGRMVVRARLTNRATFAQAYPILRLEFEDRFGSIFATRDFEPSEYLPDLTRAAGDLAPGATTEAELALVDPGADAVGYRLDVCVRESAAQLRCARGPAG
jgi:predicted Zn finger-like uncharacterized protein